VSGEVKGSAITARVRYVREHFGEAAVRAVRDALRPEHKTLLEGRVLPHEWVPFPVFTDLCVEIDRIYGKGDLALCREMGRYAARVNLPTLYRIFYALGSPEFILRRAGKVWAVHYSSGRMETQFADRAGAKIVRLGIVDFAEPHVAHCQSVLGWAEESVTLSGGTDAKGAMMSCRALGDASCEIKVEYR
jgi:hypothetical protein